jgi:hypothetical protein
MSINDPEFRMKLRFSTPKAAKAVFKKLVSLKLNAES